MTQEEFQKLESWHAVLSEISQTYVGNINLNTVMTSIASRIKEYKSKNHA